MRISNLLPGLIAIVSVAAVDFPTTIEYDVVFPRNETYNSQRALPMVFAIQNAEAAFQFGYTLTWSVTMGSNDQIRRDSDSEVPAEAVNNVWYDYGNITYFREEEPLPAGTYNVSTRYIMGSCTDTPSTVNIGVTILEASVEFTIVDDGSGVDINLSSECPVFQDTVTVERLTGPVASTASCPVIAASEGQSDPCKAQMSDSTATCILRDLTGQYNVSTCAGAPPKSGDDDEEPSGGTNSTNATQPAPDPDNNTTDSTNGTSGGDSSAQSGSNSSFGIRQYVPSFATGMIAIVVAVASL